MSQNFTLHTSQSPSLPPINNHQSLISTPPTPPHPNNGFPMVAVAVLGIAATAFLLVSYFVFVTKCNFRHWQQIDPLRRFSIRRSRLTDEPLTTSSYASPSSAWQTRGLDELLIRELPTFEYNKKEDDFSKCVVCLNEFQNHEILRVLPKCKHAFHLDCIDVWLQNNPNCPVCRSAISGRNRYRFERIVAPTSSPVAGVFAASGGDEDFVVIELAGEDGTEGERSGLLLQQRSNSFIWKSRKRKLIHRVSIMGDERIDVSERDEQFSVQPIRRSFSMDSAVDRHAYLSVQETLRQNRRQLSESTSAEESGSRSRRSIFSFGQGRGSRNAVLPVEF